MCFKLERKFSKPASQSNNVYNSVYITKMRFIFFFVKALCNNDCVFWQMACDCFLSDWATYFHRRCLRNSDLTNNMYAFQVAVTTEAAKIFPSFIRAKASIIIALLREFSSCYCSLKLPPLPIWARGLSFLTAFELVDEALLSDVGGADLLPLARWRI